MKKKLLFLTILASLVLSLVACGNGDSAKDDTNEPSSSQTSDQENTNSDLPTLEEYFSSDVMQAVVAAAAAEQYEADGIDATMYAEGDELRYEFTIEEEIPEEDRAFFAENLQTSVDASADSYMNTAAQMKAAVSNDVVVVVITFLDGAGNELYSQSFSSADAE